MKIKNTDTYKSLAAIGSTALLALAGNASAAGILLNAGFESGTGTDADNWAELGTGTERSSISPRTGNFHAYMSVDNLNNPTAGAANFIEQNLGANVLDNTQNFDLSFYAKVDSLDFTGVNIFYQILWLDQDGSDGGGVKGESLIQLTTAGINTSYQEFGMTDMDVPDGADSFILRFQLAAGAIDDIVQGFSVDDVCFGPAIPEPTSAGLLSLAGLLTLTRRKRA